MNVQNRTLFAVLERLAVSTWRRTFESPQRIKGWLLKTTLVLSGRLSCEIGISAYLFAKEVIRLYRKSGALHCALYLKQCSSSLQSAYGGVTHKPGLLPVQVSLTRSGYPRLIPAHHRRMIYRRDAKADMLVRLYLSWFSLSKLVRLSKRVSRATFSSIITEIADQAPVLSILGEMKTVFNSLVSIYMPWV